MLPVEHWRAELVGEVDFIGGTVGGMGGWGIERSAHHGWAMACHDSG